MKISKEQAKKINSLYVQSLNDDLLNFLVIKEMLHILEIDYDLTMYDQYLIFKTKD